MTNTIGYYGRGMVRQAQGDVAGAIADYEQYLALGGKDQDIKKRAEQSISALRAQLPSQGFWSNFWR